MFDYVLNRSVELFGYSSFNDVPECLNKILFELAENIFD